MQLLDLSLPTPAENVALDEALLEWAEEQNLDREFLRLWESSQPMVVVGRSSRIQIEIDESECRERHIPILRRSSGGASVVTGPGCLMYALVLSLKTRPELRDIGRAHAFILGRLATSLQARLAHSGIISRAGTSDLVLTHARGPLTKGDGFEIPARKFSGNSLRMKRTHLLCHGTLLYAFDLTLIETCLRMPPRQPDYRNARSHGDFVMNLPANRSQLADAVCAAWPTQSELTGFPMSRLDALIAERFGNERWTYEFA